MTSPTRTWQPALDLSALPAGGQQLVKLGRDQIAVFRDEAGNVFAVDNVCPHEGYPLIKGDRQGTTLTCCYHNFRFDLTNGQCLKGDEDVRIFPTRRAGSTLEIDVTEPAPDAVFAARRQSLRAGLYEGRLGQIARDIVRLLQAGVAGETIAAQAALWDAERADYGSTHVLPVVADLLPMLPRYPGAQAVDPLLIPFEMAVETHVRRPVRPIPEAVDPGDDPAAAGVDLRAAVERGDAVRAEDLLRGALARGWGRDVVEPWLYDVVTDHFLDIGHALIYQVKVFDLLAAVGWEHAPALLSAHLLRIVSGTREDVLPTWSWLRARLEAAGPQLERWYRALGDGDDAPATSLHEALIDGDRQQVVARLEEALERGTPLRRIIDALSLAASERLLRFDVARDLDPTAQDGWLDVTHALTFVQALREAAPRHRAPGILRLVYFAAYYIDRLRALDASTPTTPPPPPSRADRAAVEDRIIATVDARPIFTVHFLKLTVAAFKEADAMDDDAPLAALQRVLDGPHRQFRRSQAAHEAKRLLLEGKVPRRSV